MTEFLDRWRANGWKARSGNPVLNLWRELDELASYHRVTWTHVGGHSGHADQERCDALALESARQTKWGSPQELVKTFKYRRFSEMTFLGTLGS
jgi:ribonuclease HI